MQTFVPDVFLTVLLSTTHPQYAVLYMSDQEQVMINIWDIGKLIHNGSFQYAFNIMQN